MSAVVLRREDWRRLEDEHRARADALTAAHRRRAGRGETHPVEDFLFTYYSYKPAVLRRWHPGAGTVLADAADEARAGWRWYRVDARGGVALDTVSFTAHHPGLIAWIRFVLTRTRDNAAQFGCFGLHEWAMAYRTPEVRHPVPLRLGAAGTDAVVESHELRCTHFDAYRFFTEAAVPRIRAAPTPERVAEQAGCLHSGMDLYKWAVKLGPLVPGSVLLDAFVLAREIRQLDMAASPYDLSAWDVAPVPIETAAGKAEYVARQRGFSERAASVRDRLLAILDATSTGQEPAAALQSAQG